MITSSNRVLVIRISWLMSLLTLWASALFALDPKKSLSQYVHDTWTTDHGLPQNTIDAIVQSQDGYLWIGTFSGLARFDGIEFKVFDNGNTAEIKHNHFSSMLNDAAGTLWLGTNGGGVCRLKDGVFSSFSTKEGLSNDFVRAMCLDGRGNIWVGTEGGGLNCLSTDSETPRCTIYRMKQGLANDKVRSLYADRHGMIWIGTSDGGLSRFDPATGVFTNYTIKDGLPDNTIYAVQEDSRGKLLIGTGRGLCEFEDGHFKTYPETSKEVIRTIYLDKKNNLWIGTDGGGLARLDHGQFEVYTTRDGLSNNFVRTLYEDVEGSLWIGTRGGLSRLQDGKFTTYTQREGLADNFVRCIFEDRSGNLWMGTNGGGLNVMEDGKFKTYTVKDGLANNFIRAIYEDSEGSLWIGTDGGGVSQFKNGRFRSITTKNGLSHNFVRAIMQDHRGHYWIGTYGGGLTELTADPSQPSGWRSAIFNTKNGFPDDFIFSVYEDAQHRMWVGTNGKGLIAFDPEAVSSGGKFTSYTTHDGLTNDFVFSFYDDHHGSFWIGTNGGGLNRLKDGKFTSYRVKDGLFDNVILQITEDNKNNLWIGSSKGIFQISKKQFDDFDQGVNPTVRCIVYGKGDGLNSLECSGASQPTACKTRDGKIWFPTLIGVAVINPDNIFLNARFPPVLIEKIIIDDQTINSISKNILTVNPGPERFEFHCVGLSFLAPEKVKFKFQLVGFDKNWIDAGSRRTAFYTNLDYGQYTFNVIACNNDGVWNEAGAGFTFYIRPHYYQSVWFQLFCLGLIGVVLAGAFRWRVRHLRIREEALSRLVEKRTRHLNDALAETEKARREAEEHKDSAEKSMTTLKETQVQLVHTTKMASLGQLVAGLAHEMNNPLSYVYGNLFVLEDYIRHFKDIIDEYERPGPRSDPVQKKVDQLKSEVHYDHIASDVDALLASCKQGTERVKNIVLFLRTFSRLDEAEIKLADIHEGIESALVLFLPLYENQLVIHKHYGKIPMCECFPSQLNQVFMNVLLNAAYAVEQRNQSEKRAKGNVWITTRSENDTVRISIKDDGTGIPEPVRPKIFDPFFTTKPVGKGMGLGLSICYSIIERHGGQLNFNSELDKGTEFIIEIPLRLKNETSL